MISPHPIPSPRPVPVALPDRTPPSVPAEQADPRERALLAGTVTGVATSEFGGSTE